MASDPTLSPSPSGAPTAPSTGQPARGVFADRNFRLFFGGQVVSNIGNWLQLTAQAVLVKELSGSSFVVGALTAAMLAPVWFLALPGGRLADRIDRRRLTIATQVLAAVATGVLAVLAWSGTVTIAAVFIVAALVGVQFAISLPTMMALLPQIVEPRLLGQAIGMNSITYNVARALGPALATGIIATIGFGWTFALNSVSFLALIAAFVMIRPQAPPARGSGSGSVRAAVEYAWGHAQIRTSLLALAAIAVAFAPLVALSPTFARDVFSHPAADAGLLMSAFGLGAIVGAIGVTRGFRAHGRPRVHLLVFTGLLMACGLVVLAFAPSFLVAMAGLFVAGIGFTSSTVTLTTELQQSVDDEVRGRVMGLWTLSFLGIWPIAAPVAGAIADAWTPEAAVLVMLVPLALSTLLLVPRLRRAAARS